MKKNKTIWFIPVPFNLDGKDTLPCLVNDCYKLPEWLHWYSFNLCEHLLSVYFVSGVVLERRIKYELIKRVIIVVINLLTVRVNSEDEQSTILPGEVRKSFINQERLGQEIPCIVPTWSRYFKGFIRVGGTYRQRTRRAHAIAYSLTGPQFRSMLGCMCESQHSSWKGFQPHNSTYLWGRRYRGHTSDYVTMAEKMTLLLRGRLQSLATCIVQNFVLTRTCCTSSLLMYPKGRKWAHWPSRSVSSVSVWGQSFIKGKAVWNWRETRDHSMSGELRVSCNDEIYSVRPVGDGHQKVM